MTEASRLTCCWPVVVALSFAPAGHGLAQSPFKSSLTATVIIQSETVGRKNGEPAEAKSGSVPLGCREVTLQWGKLAGATHYAVYVSSRTDGPWTALPPANVCGRPRWHGATSLTDVEPTTGAASVVHRLYYKVFALAADAATLAVTDAVEVELP